MLTKKQDKALKDYMRTTLPENVAYAKLTSRNTKPGVYRFLPIISYLTPYKGRTHLVINGILVTSAQDTHGGTLVWDIPLTDATREDALALLVALGWTGRVWPCDPGWPDDDKDEMEGMSRVLYDSYLDASLVFPPHPEQGCRVIRVHVLKGTVRFPLPLWVEDEDRVEVTPEVRARFAEILATPYVFHEQAITTPQSRFQFVRAG